MGRVVYIFLSSTVIVVGCILGATNPFAVWNAFPVVIAGVVYGFVTTRNLECWAQTHNRFGLYGFMFCTVVTVLVTHLAWMFDLLGTATGSSTSALVFVVLPGIALLAGFFGWILGYLAGFCVEKASRRTFS